MKLQTLKLENFQGIKEIDYTFDGKDASVYGDNGTGKTTLFNAFTWLLTGKSSTGAKSYSPKTKGNNGDDLHNLTHAVEAVMINDKGSQTVYRRAMKENYVKKKGSSSETFEGHTIEYFIDGVPLKEKEFKATLERDMGSEEQIKILTMPDFFSEQLTWDKRRELLLGMCNEDSGQLDMDADPKFKELMEILKKPRDTQDRYTPEDFQKVGASRAKEIKKEIDSLPARIDEANRSLPDLDGIRTEDFLISEIINMELLIDKKRDAQSMARTTDGDFLEKQKQIAALEASMAEARVGYIQANSEKNEHQYAIIREKEEKLGRLRNEAISLGAQLKEQSLKVEHLRNLRELLYTEYIEVESQRWNPSQETCPTCSQNLPPQEIQKAKEAFHLGKSQRLEQINTDGQKCSKEVITRLELEITQIQSQLEEKDTLKEALDEDISNLRSQITSLPPFEHTKEYGEFSRALEKVAAKNEESTSNENRVQDGLSEQIGRLSSQLDQLKSELLQYDLAEKQKVRVAELEEKELRLAREFEKIQRGLFLCDEFTRWKIHQLTEKINQQFNTVKFQLFEDQINGGLRECCEVLVPSDKGALVPYSLSANNAARINAGLEIINTLSDYWQKSLPIFVDNAESVTRLLPITNQVIRLVVNEKDTVLRMQIDEESSEKRGA